MNEKWECYLCSIDDVFDNKPGGYLGNYHPLCLNCTNKIYYDVENKERFRLTYHIDIGNLLFF